MSLRGVPSPSLSLPLQLTSHVCVYEAVTMADWLQTRRVERDKSTVSLLKTRFTHHTSAGAAVPAVVALTTQIEPNNGTATRKRSRRQSRHMNGSRQRRTQSGADTVDKQPTVEQQEAMPAQDNGLTISCDRAGVAVRSGLMRMGSSSRSHCSLAKGDQHSSIKQPHRVALTTISHEGFDTAGDLSQSVSRGRGAQALVG